jgi:hypothetical protein
MAAADEALVAQSVTSSPLNIKYAVAIDRVSAYEMLAARAAAAEQAAAREAAMQAAAQVPPPRPTPARQTAASATRTSRNAPKPPPTFVEQVLGSSAVKGLANSLGKEITRSIFGTRKR